MLGRSNGLRSRTGLPSTVESRVVLQVATRNACQHEHRGQSRVTALPLTLERDDLRSALKRRMPCLFVPVVRAGRALLSIRLPIWMFGRRAQPRV